MKKKIYIYIFFSLFFPLRPSLDKQKKEEDMEAQCLTQMLEPGLTIDSEKKKRVPGKKVNSHYISDSVVRILLSPRCARSKWRVSSSNLILLFSNVSSSSSFFFFFSSFFFLFFYPEIPLPPRIRRLRKVLHKLGRKRVEHLVNRKSDR